MDVCRRTTHSIKSVIAIALSLLSVQAAFAVAVPENQQVVVEGTLTDNGGNAIDLSGATLVFYVLTGDGCYLYGESSSTAGDSQGNILHRMGSSSAVTGSPNTFSQNLFFGVVSGTTSFAGNECNATAASTRLVQVYYQTENIRATLSVGTVPYAHNATMLSGKNVADFLQVTTDSNTLFYGGSAGQILSKSASGTLSWTTPSLTAAQVTTALGYTPASTTASLTASSITTALGYTPANSASAGSVTNITAGQGLSGGSINSSGTISINFGSSSGTVAAGNDSRIVGALQSVNNLSEISSATTARSNLGLGSLATQSTVLLTSDVSGVLPAANGGSKWSSHVSGAYYLNNISIGSSSVLSSTKLYAESNASSQVAFFKNTSTTGYGVRIDVANSDPSLYALNVKNNLNSIFMVQNDGNIGVGTMTPTARMHFAAGTSSQAPLRFTSGTLLTTPSAGTMEYDGFLYITDNANVRRTIATGSTNTSIDNISTINSPGNLTLSTTGVVTVNGSLGIGTTSPAAKLHVFSSSSEIARFDGNSSGSYVTFTNNGTDKGFFGYGSGSTMFTNGVTTGMMLRSESHIYLGSQNQAHLMVHSTGKVGVGTLSPTRELTVSGVVRASGGVEFGDGSVQQTSAWGGIQHVNANCSAANECMVTCPGSKKVVSGGCLNSATGTIAPLISSYPGSTTQWNCKWGTGALAVSAFAICTDM